ncbi:MAG TPA: (2Fe-2S)-binding protein [Solirubrobacteraceae bacterium]|jgi:isoquinoline 1-oxidoreductase alpha subunit|nr:(2Fe-2S)-binding protein [Solirubrobacteraceae bacterium]
MPTTTHTFILNGKHVSVQCDGGVHVLWVLRDLLGVTGPKYGCGLNVCKACTSHLNGKAFHPCSVAISEIKPTDEIVTIEGLAATVGKALHPMQQAWLDFDVAQCGYCQPGQIMTAVALVEQVQAEGRQVTEADLDAIRNVCRCGTYFRVREAIMAGAGQPGCPAATGKLSGETLGLVKLGMTRKQARHAYQHSSNRHKSYEDFFCLSPAGVRVGYASRALLETLPAHKRHKFEGRVVWASTSNPFYEVHGVRPGATLASAHKHLKLTGPFYLGLNRWYLAPNGKSTAVLKVRKDKVEEIGIGDKALTAGHPAQRAFLRSFS